MKKGGGARADRHLGFWCLVLSIMGLLVWLKVIDVSKNYTDLHKRVHSLEYWRVEHEK